MLSFFTNGPLLFSFNTCACFLSPSSFKKGFGDGFQLSKELSNSGKNLSKQN